MSICSGFFLSRRRTPRCVVGYCPGFPGITAASESTVAQWQQAPTKRSPELLKSSIAEKKSTHQQGKKKALLIHSSIPLGVADWPVGDPEDWHLEVGCSLAFWSSFRRRNSHFWALLALDRYLEWVKKAPSHALPCIWVWYGALDTFQVGSLTLEPALYLGVIFAIKTVTFGPPPAINRCPEWPKQVPHH